MKRKGEGSKPPKPKKNKVDPLQQSLLSFYQPLRGNRQEVQQEVLGNDDNDDDDLDLVQHENPPLGYDESFVRWPFTCCTMDQMLVNTAAAMRKAVDHNTPGESYFVSNSEGTSISGYHWFGAVLQISVGGSFEDVVDLGGADD